MDAFEAAKAIWENPDPSLAGCGKTDAATQIVSELCDFVTKGRVFGCIRRSFSGREQYCDLGLRRVNRQIPHADEVIGGGRKGEDPSHLEDSTMPDLPQQCDRLQPSKA